MITLFSKNLAQIDFVRSYKVFFLSSANYRLWQCVPEIKKFDFCSLLLFYWCWSTEYKMRVLKSCMIAPIQFA